MRIAVACGGTGGHVFPGLVTACALRARGHEVTLWLAGRAVEDVSIGDWKGGVFRTGISSTSGNVITRPVKALFQWLAAMPASRRAMRHDRPDVLLAMGSYTSVVPVLTAWSLGVPVVLHEANAVPGRAVSFLSRFASRIAITFPSSASWFRRKQVVHTGLPLRRLDNGDFSDAGLNPGVFTVLVMGGSQGAHRLNEVATAALRRIHARGTVLQVVHLTGAADETSVRNSYSAAGVKAVTHGFLSEMAKAYGAADVAISRSGAGACMELAMHGIPALFVPYPFAMRDHQMKNARSLESAGAAVVVPQDDFSEDAVIRFVDSLAADSARYAAMKKALAGIAIPDAVDKLADLVVSAGRT